MAVFHKNLTREKWNGLSKDKQILNIAAELSRARKMLIQSEMEYFQQSLNRGLELIELTSDDRHKWQGNSLRELLRLKEVLGAAYIKNPEMSNVKSFSGLIKCLLNFNPLSSVVQL